MPRVGSSKFKKAKPERASLDKFPETRIQKNCVRWWRMQYARLVFLLFHIPNGGFRTAVEGAIFKGLGVVPGVADLFLSIPNEKFHGLYIEIKTDSGKQTENQINFQKWVVFMGYDYKVARDVDSFIVIISDYLRGTPHFKPTWKDLKNAGNAMKNVDNP